ncbi:AbrB family transcriptional regulator [Aestuariivita boseongensis]|uniref:AbrB family transcriptional regulator n=1 Tax=Aestuariivita boseongensis TaxID=1470562 RepID=UPI000A7B10FE|nr:AbrB family transcriptional regulator [Aestuariivita boseongensis]
MTTPAHWHSLSSTLYTLAIAGGGAALATSINLPAALLTGPALAVSAAGLLGLRMEIAPRLRDLAFLIIGVGIGSTVTPETLSIMAQLPLAFVVLFVLLFAMMRACQSMLVRGFGFDPRTAILAAAPGHLSFVIGLSIDQGVDTLRVTVVQAVRLLALTLIVPVIARLMGVEITGNPLASGATLPWLQFAGLLAVSFAFGLGLQRLRVPAALLIAAMVISAAGHGADLVQGGLHPWLGTVSFVTIGALIGTRFSGLSWFALRASFVAGLLVTTLASSIALLGALPVAWLLGLDPVTVLAAFAPGGFETMIALGAVLGANPGFVAAAHVARLMCLTGLIPFMLGRAGRLRQPGT